MTITFESEPVTIGRVQANSAGAFTAQVGVPADASPGNHTIKATGLAPDGAMRVASTAVTISGASSGASSGGSSAPGSQGSTGSKGGLAFTGLQTLMVGEVGAGVLAAGVVLVTMSRRWRSDGGPPA